jgi:polyhydroxyalkanoate synthesis regulator protein
MELFQQTFSMFKPFTPSRSGPEEKAPEPAAGGHDNIDDLRRQMKEMQDRLDRMSSEPKKDEQQ